MGPVKTKIKLGCETCVDGAAGDLTERKIGLSSSCVNTCYTRRIGNETRTAHPAGISRVILALSVKALRSNGFIG